MSSNKNTPEGSLHHLSTLEQTSHLIILGLLAPTLDLVQWTFFGTSVVNAYIFTANNCSGNPLWSWSNTMNIRDRIWQVHTWYRINWYDCFVSFIFFQLWVFSKTVFLTQSYVQFQGNTHNIRTIYVQFLCNIEFVYYFHVGLVWTFKCVVINISIECMYIIDDSTAILKIACFKQDETLLTSMWIDSGLPLFWKYAIHI